MEAWRRRRAPSASAAQVGGAFPRGAASNGGRVDQGDSWRGASKLLPPAVVPRRPSSRDKPRRGNNQMLSSARGSSLPLYNAVCSRLLVAAEHHPLTRQRASDPNQRTPLRLFTSSGSSCTEAHPPTRTKEQQQHQQLPVNSLEVRASQKSTLNSSSSNSLLCHQDLPWLRPTKVLA